MSRSLTVKDLIDLSSVIEGFVADNNRFALSELLRILGFPRTSRNCEVLHSYLAGMGRFKFEKVYFCTHCGVRLHNPPENKPCPCCQKMPAKYTSDVICVTIPPKSFRLGFLQVCCMCGQTKPIVATHTNGKHICKDCALRLRQIVRMESRYEPKKT